MTKINDYRNNNLFLFLGALFLCFLISLGVRFNQFKLWEKNPNVFFVGDRPMMTTLDAPYWLRLARYYNENKFGQKDSLRGYPDSTKTFKENAIKELNIPKKFEDRSNNFPTSQIIQPNTSKEILYRDVPLISFLIAHIVKFFKYNYYLAGTLMIPFMASLFIFPFGIYFYRIGVPISGLLGGLIGTFSGGYFFRSSIGRIDTDMLNLFFPALAGLFILLASLQKSERWVLFYSILTGLSLFLFNWWYNKPLFILAYFIVMIISFFIHHIRFRTILLGGFLYVLCVHPLNFLESFDSTKIIFNIYFSSEETSPIINTTLNNGNPAIFPNVFKTISEADTVEIDEVFRRIISNIFLAKVGLIVFIFFAVARWRYLIPMTPMLAIGFLSFQSANRFIMYLAPFVGIGFGCIINLGIENIFKYFVFNKNNDKKNREVKNKLFVLNWPEMSRQVSPYIVMTIFFILIYKMTSISFVPMPSIHTRIYSTFLEVKNRVPKGSALMTWWDYGYAITDATGLSTFHDGSSQFGPKTYFIAKSLVSSDQNELYKISKYLATEGSKGLVENNTSAETLLNTVRNPSKNPSDSIYLFFTADMTAKFGAISRIGSWDIVNGKSNPSFYQKLSCNKFTNLEINCNGAKIDIKKGFINNNIPLNRMIIIRDGKVIKEKEFGHKNGVYLQLFVVGKQIVDIHLINEKVFRSNFNQMFLLGRYEKKLFEEIYNAFPFSRLYQFKF